jgi:C1A family cysteine protease
MYGPVVVTLHIEDTSPLHRYGGGIYDRFCREEKHNHAVVLVGWGIFDDKISKKNIEYWILRNSWGPIWGEKGYFKVKIDGNCNI